MTHLSTLFPRTIALTTVLNVLFYFARLPVLHSDGGRMPPLLFFILPIDVFLPIIFHIRVTIQRMAFECSLSAKCSPHILEREMMSFDELSERWQKEGKRGGNRGYQKRIGEGDLRKHKMMHANGVIDGKG
ncbi:MAG: hypothetical protein QW578_07395 [Thermoplasmatales archaeon]